MLLFLNCYYAKSIGKLEVLPSKAVMGDQIIGLLYELELKIINFENEKLVSIDIDDYSVLDFKFSYYDTCLAILSKYKIIIYS